MKAPNEIKAELATRVPVHFHKDGEPRLTPIQYVALEALHADAFAYIHQLETKYDEVFRLCGDLHHDMLEQQERADKLEAERDAAVEDIRMLGRTGEFICPVCAHYNHGEGTKGECVKCLTGDGFRWRGEKTGGDTP